MEKASELGVPETSDEELFDDDIEMLDEISSASSDEMELYQAYSQLNTSPNPELPNTQSDVSESENETITVAALSPQESLQGIVDNWNLLIEEFMLSHRLVGGQFRDTVSSLADDSDKSISNDTPEARQAIQSQLIITFRDHNSCLLVQNSASFRKQLEEFIVSKLKNPGQLSLHFQVDPNIPIPVKPETVLIASSEEVVKEVPIMAYLIELFEARIIN